MRILILSLFYSDQTNSSSVVDSVNLYVYIIIIIIIVVCVT